MAPVICVIVFHAMVTGKKIFPTIKKMTYIFKANVLNGRTLKLDFEKEDKYKNPNTVT